MPPNIPHPAGTTMRMIRHFETTEPVEVEVHRTGQRIVMKLTQFDLHFLRYGQHPWKFVSVIATGQDNARETWTSSEVMPPSLRSWLAAELGKIVPALNSEESHG